ncbi:hypothetical protein [Photorhabdus namnaonensis]|uniref:Uncharacterized protein n=1 Tax=Photorhabdus namnaonensis TaxID=1851568 RepID=A0A1B8YFM0_9GAMM|nr:hypothetical protein [Photorhabdus namnaonensis]OCA53958.1 hypothetical protein Phpb_03062 [Photorhabdus namnaonensis]
MKIDLTLCGKILTKLAEYYPKPANNSQFTDIENLAGDEDVLIANLTYMEQHHLLISGIKRGLNNSVYTGGLVLTERGIDYIREDGGLSVMLDKSTINRQMYDALLQALLDQIQASPEAQNQKEALTSQLQALPAETIKHLYMKLLDQGVSYLPGVFQLIQKWLHLE